MPIQIDKETKFIVLSVKHVLEHLSLEQMDQLNKIQIAVYDKLKQSDKTEYWVVNKDEPYAENIWKVIESGEIQKRLIELLGSSYTSKK